MSKNTRLRISFDETISPELNDELKEFVNCREKLLVSRSYLWNELINKLLHAFTSKGLILNKQREYKVLQGYVSETYPKIPLDVFNRKMRKAFGNYRSRGGNKESKEEMDSGTQEASSDGVGENFPEVNNTATIGSNNDDIPDLVKSPRVGEERLYVEILEDREIIVCEMLSFSENITAFANSDEIIVIEIMDDPNETDGLIYNEGTSNQNVVIENLINFEKSDFQASQPSTFSDSAFLHKVLKRTARCIPTIKPEYVNDIVRLQSEFISSQEITPDFLTMFRRLCDQRTILLRICPIYVLTSQYHCLNLAKVLACEIEILYNHLELMQLYKNADAFYEAVLKLEYPQTGGQALTNVFKRINEGESFIRLFEKEPEFKRFSPMLTDNKKFLSIYEIMGETKAVRVLAFGLKVDCASVTQGLVFVILLHHVLERPFSHSFVNEFEILESFLFRSFSEKLMLKYSSFCTRILETFGDLETFEISSTGNTKGVFDISLL